MNWNDAKKLDMYLSEYIDEFKQKNYILNNLTNLLSDFPDAPIDNQWILEKKNYCEIVAVAIPAQSNVVVDDIVYIYFEDHKLNGKEPEETHDEIEEYLWEVYDKMNDIANEQYHE